MSDNSSGAFRNQVYEKKNSLSNMTYFISKLDCFTFNFEVPFHVQIS